MYFRANRWVAGRTHQYCNVYLFYVLELFVNQYKEILNVQ